MENGATSRDKTTGRGAGLDTRIWWCPRDDQVEMSRGQLGRGQGWGYRFGSHGHGGDGSLRQDVEMKSIERSRDLGRDSGEQGWLERGSHGEVWEEAAGERQRACSSHCSWLRTTEFSLAA